MTRTNSGLPPPDPPTLATLLTPRQRSTTGSMRTGKTEELRKRFGENSEQIYESIVFISYPLLLINLPKLI